MCVKVIGFVTVEEAARLRGFRRGYILDLVRRGCLSAEVIFGRVLVRRRDVELIEQAKPGHKPARRRTPPGK